MTDSLDTKPDLSMLLNLLDGDEAPELAPAATGDYAEALRGWRDALVRLEEIERQLETLDRPHTTDGQTPQAAPSRGAYEEPGAGRVAHEELLSPAERALVTKSIEPVDLKPLREARATPAVGREIPDFSYQSRWKRPLSRFLARLVFRVAGVITASQRRLNESFIHQLQTLGDRFDLLAAERNNLARVLDQAVVRSQESFHRLSSRIEILRAEVDRAHTALRRAASQSGRLELGLRHELAESEKRNAWQRLRIAELQQQLAAVSRRTDLIEQSWQGLPSASDPDHLNHLLFDYPDPLRGPREAVIRDLKDFLPLVREHGLATGERPALALGCGRGEWLELLSGNGLVCRGVDPNKTAVGVCRAAGFAAEVGDALAHLRRLPDSSIGLVTAFDYLESLPLARLVELFTEIVRVLQPGGMAILETLNPENLDVRAAWVRHLHPPNLLLFLLEKCGFTDLELKRPNPPRPANMLIPLDSREPLAAKLNPVIELLNARYAVPTCYAVIGRTPAALQSQ